jgi:hypothetical protein
MIGIKHWYKEKMEAVGHLAAMEDAYLRRMYASKVVNGMSHLAKALDEKVANSGYEYHKRDFQLMKESLVRAMEHVKKEYEVTEDNISYKWNTKNGLPQNLSLPSAIPNLNENRLTINSNRNRNVNPFDEDELTLEDLRNFTATRSEERANSLRGNTLAANSLRGNTLTANTLPGSLNRLTLNANLNRLPNANANANRTANRTANANANRTANRTANANANKKKNTLFGGRRARTRSSRSRTRRSNKN